MILCVGITFNILIKSVWHKLTYCLTQQLKAARHFRAGALSIVRPDNVTLVVLVWGAVHRQDKLAELGLAELRLVTLKKEQIDF